MSLVKQGRGQIVMPGFVNHGVSSILMGFDAFKLRQTVTSSRRRFVLGTLLALLLLNTGFVVSASAQSSALDSILNPSILGAQVPYLESKVGPAWQVVPGYAGLPEERVYKIDQCTLRTGVSNNTISYVKLDLSPSCSVNLNSFIIRSPAIPPAKKLTFGIFDSIVGPGTYSTECFPLDCPASSPTFIYDKYDGPMSDNSIGIIAVASAETQSAMNASTSWEQSIKSGTNTFGMFADTTLDQKRYNCNGAFNSQAASAFQNTRLNSIIIVGAVPGGVQPLGPWSGCPMAQVDVPLPAAQIQSAVQPTTSTPQPATLSGQASSQTGGASGNSVSNGQSEVPTYVPVIMLVALFGFLIYSTDRLIDKLRRRATISLILPIVGVSIGFLFAFAMTWLIVQTLTSGHTNGQVVESASGNSSTTVSTGAMGTDNAQPSASGPVGANLQSIPSDSEAQWTNAHRITGGNGTQAIPPSFHPISPSDASVPAPSNGVPPVLPASLQGVWALDCSGAANGSSQFGYFAFGPNLQVLSAMPSGLSSSTSKIISFTQVPGGFAVSVDGAYDPNDDQAKPTTIVSVYSTPDASTMKMLFSFDSGNGTDGFVFDSAGSAFSKCPSDPAFSSAVSASTTAIAPTAAEIEDSQSTLREIPSVQGIIFSSQIWSSVAPILNNVTVNSPYSNGVSISLHQFLDASAYQGATYDLARSSVAQCDQIDQDSPDNLIRGCAVIGLRACELATAQSMQIPLDCMELRNIQ